MRHLSSMPVLCLSLTWRINTSLSNNDNIFSCHLLSSLSLSLTPPLSLSLSLSPSLSLILLRYPHLACEILTADVFTIVEALATAEKFLPMLWKFLHDEPPLNPLIARYITFISFTPSFLLLSFVLCSFNSKILAMLLGQRTTLFLEYIQKIEGFVDHFLKHLGTSAMMDLLLQMIAAPEGDQGRQDVAMVMFCYLFVCFIYLFISGYLMKESLRN